MGSSYDLEMQTFLDRRDVLDPCEADDDVGGEVGVASKGGDGGGRRKRKRQRAFVDSSDEENFVPPAKSSKSKSLRIESPENEAAEEHGSLEKEGSSSPDPMEGVVDVSDGEGEEEEKSEEGEGRGESPKVQRRGREGREKRSGATVGGKRRREKDVVVFTASQHIVPRAPSAECMDWLDDLDPNSQSQSHSQGSLTHPDQVDTPETTDTTEAANACGFDPDNPIDLDNPTAFGTPPDQDVLDAGIGPKGMLSSTPKGVTELLDAPGDPELVFRTPKPPLPSKRRSSKAFPASCRSTPDARSVPATPSSRGELQKPANLGSVDMFDDFSTQDIFAEFTTPPSCLRSKGYSSNLPSTSMDRDSPQKGEASKIGLNQVTRKRFCKDPSSSVSTGGDRIGESVTHATACDNYDNDDVIVLSPECKKTPAKTPDSHRKTADSAPGSGGSYVLHHRRGKSKRANFLESPQEGEESEEHLLHGSKKRGRNSPVSSRSKGKPSTAKRLIINLDSSDDDDNFTAPLRKRLQKLDKTKKTAWNATLEGQPLPRNNLKEHSLLEQSYREFIDDQAELTQEDSVPCDAEEMDNSYDMEDSFINDNSMLTQYNTQAPRAAVAQKKVKKSSESGGDMYRQSLVSPKDKIFLKRRCDAGKGRYRMVLSQRHHLLNHYMDKAGFHCSEDEDGEGESVGGNWRRGLAGGNRKRKCLDLSTSGSEAEEVGVVYGEEDLAELSQSQGGGNDDPAAGYQGGTPDQDSDPGENAGSPEMFPEATAYNEESMAKAFLSDLEKDEEDFTQNIISSVVGRDPPLPPPHPSSRASEHRERNMSLKYSKTPQIRTSDSGYSENTSSINPPEQSRQSQWDKPAHSARWNRPTESFQGPTSACQTNSSRFQSSSGSSTATTSRLHPHSSSRFQSHSGDSGTASSRLQSHSSGGGTASSSRLQSHSSDGSGPTLSRFQSSSGTSSSHGFQSHSSDNEMGASSRPQFHSRATSSRLQSRSHQGGTTLTRVPNSRSHDGGTASSHAPDSQAVSGNSEICKQCGEDHYNIEGARVIDISRFRDTIVSPGIKKAFQAFREHVKRGDSDAKKTPGDSADTGEQHLLTHDIDESFFEDDLELSQDYH